MGFKQFTFFIDILSDLPYWIWDYSHTKIPRKPVFIMESSDIGFNIRIIRNYRFQRFYNCRVAIFHCFHNKYGPGRQKPKKNSGIAI
jgi:hypothetical protein